MKLDIAAIIFDFNGLIIDDEPIHCELFQQVLRDEDIMLTDKNYWEDYLGFDDKGLITAVYERDKKNITPKKMKELIEKKNALYFPALKTKLKLFPQAKEFVEYAHSRFPISIVSGALRSEIEFVLNECDLKKYFLDIVAADDTKHGKPDPEGYLMGLTHLKKQFPHIIPANCLVLEDSLAGVESGKRAGMKVVAMTHTYERAELQKTKADAIVDRFDEIKLLLA